MTRMQYCEGILAGFEYVMARDPKCLAIGQGLWSPWYVGRSMDGLDKKFGLEKINPLVDWTKAPPRPPGW